VRPAARSGGEQRSSPYLQGVRPRYSAGYGCRAGYPGGCWLGALDDHDEQLGGADECHRRLCRDHGARRAVGRTIGDIGGTRRPLLTSCNIANDAATISPSTDSGRSRPVVPDCP